MEKIKKHSNTALKIISLILAIVLWAYVAYQDSPDISHWFDNIPITEIGMDELDASDYHVMSTDHKTIRVKLRGDRTALSKIEPDDINVQLDVSGIRQEGSVPVRLKVTVDSANVSVVSFKPDVVSVTTEKMMTDVIPIELNLVGSPEAGYGIFDKTLSYNGNPIKEAAVRGAKSVISSLASVSTRSVSVQGSQKDGVVSVGLMAYNTDGQVVSGVTFEPSSVDVGYTVLKEKSVSLNVALTNIPINKDVTYSPTTIKVYGSEDVLSGIESISSQQPLDVSGAKNGDKYSVQLSLPAGARLITDSSITDITVSVNSLNDAGSPKDNDEKDE